MLQREVEFATSRSNCVFQVLTCVFEGLFAEIDQHEFEHVRLRIFPDKPLKFHCGPATYVQNTHRTSCFHGASHQVVQTLAQNIDPVTVRNGNTCLKKHVVDQLKVSAGSLPRVAQNLIDHFIIAGIAKWFGESAVNEGSAQNQRMNCSLGEAAMHGRSLNVDTTSFIFKPQQVLAPFFKQWIGQFEENILANTPVVGSRQARVDVGLINPACNLGKISAHFANHDLIVAPHVESLIPALHK